jgi:uncharacterized protein YceK
MGKRWLVLVILACAMWGGLAGCATVHTQAGPADRPAPSGSRY